MTSSHAHALSLHTHHACTRTHILSHTRTRMYTHTHTLSLTHTHAHLPSPPTHTHTCRALMYGFKLRILDLGGGFPGDKMAPVQFDAIADVLRPALDKHFPAAEFPESDLDIIAEPGRYFVSSCCTLATRVIAKRSIPSAEEGEDKSVMYYINDGVYGAFNCVLYDHQIVHAQVLRAAKEGKVLATTVWGPSCDSMDCVKKDITLPELEEGDYIYWENMGAYTFCAQSNFNGFENSTPFYTYSTTADSELQLAALPKAFPVQADSTPTSLDAVEWSARPHY